MDPFDEIVAGLEIPAPPGTCRRCHGTQLVGSRLFPVACPDCVSDEIDPTPFGVTGHDADE